MVRISDWINEHVDHWFNGSMRWPVDPSVRRDPGYVYCYWFDDWQDPAIHTLFKLRHSDIILECRLEEPEGIF